MASHDRGFLCLAACFSKFKLIFQLNPANMLKCDLFSILFLGLLALCESMGELCFLAVLGRAV